MFRETKAEKEERKTEALVQLRKICPPGTTIYCVLAHVSRSGMQREIKFYTITSGKRHGRDVQDIAWLSGYMSRVLGYRRGKRDGLIVSGCGMDMGFHVVNSLSYALHGMKDVGRGAIKAANDGRPFTATAKSYRAGYSLECKWL